MPVYLPHHYHPYKVRDFNANIGDFNIREIYNHLIIAKEYLINLLLQDNPNIDISRLKWIKNEGIYHHRLIVLDQDNDNDKIFEKEYGTYWIENVKLNLDSGTCVY